MVVPSLWWYSRSREQEDRLGKVEPQERHGWQFFLYDWLGERCSFQG